MGRTMNMIGWIQTWRIFLVRINDITIPIERLLTVTLIILDLFLVYVLFIKLVTLDSTILPVVRVNTWQTSVAWLESM